MNQPIEKPGLVDPENIVGGVGEWIDAKLVFPTGHEPAAGQMHPDVRIENGEGTQKESQQQQQPGQDPVHTCQPGLPTFPKSDVRDGW